MAAPFATKIQRLLNSGRKALAGLTLHGESVWPGVENDLFVAHLSIYAFFSRYTPGCRVLDAGCGAGYGSAYIQNFGRAASVVGIDLDPRNIRFARRRYQLPTVQFDVVDCEAVGSRFRPASQDVIVASNILEHLRNPKAFVEAAVSILTPLGKLIVALPPIVNEWQKSENDAIPYHRSNLYVDEWISLFRSTGFSERLFRQDWQPGVREPDFSSPFRSELTTESFLFEETTRNELYLRPCLGVIYELSKPGTSQDQK
jgi:SAM-dependent methyltransferase